MRLTLFSLESAMKKNILKNLVFRFCDTTSHQSQHVLQSCNNDMHVFLSLHFKIIGVIFAF